MGNPTRFPAGISTSSVNTNLGNYPLPNPTTIYTSFKDFGTYAAGDWTVTTGANAGTAALTAGLGGLLLLTTAGTTTADYEALASNPADFNFTSTEKAWFYTRFQVSDATNPIIIAGLTAGSLGATLAPTDGIYFAKASGSTSISLVIKKSSTATTIASVATLANATYIELGWYYNGAGQIDYFVNEVKVGSTSTMTNLPTAVALGHGFGIVNGAAAAKTMTVDFVLGAQERGA